MKPLQNFTKFLLDTLFPQFCLGCNKEGAIICPDCLSLIEITEYVFCPFCSTPTRVLEKAVCEKHHSRNLSGIFSAASYQQPLVKKLIRNFKYKPFLKTLSPYLAYLIIAHFALTKNNILLQHPENSIFVPVPLSKRKQRQRGFNQATLLAKELALAFKIPSESKNLVKTKNTPSQTELGREERVENIKNSFLVKNPALIAGKTVFLVDDVFTTGSTMEECAKVLKAAGAKTVWGITVAREPLV